MGLCSTKRLEEPLYVEGHQYYTYLPSITVMVLVCFQFLLQIPGLYCGLSMDEDALGKGGQGRGKRRKKKSISTDREKRKLTPAEALLTVSPCGSTAYLIFATRD